MVKKKGSDPSEKPESEEVDFESSLAELETIVRRLEQGGGALEQALGDYAQAIELLRACHGRLEQAERKIEILSGIDANGNPILREVDDQELSLEDKQRVADSVGQFHGRPAMSESRVLLKTMVPCSEYSMSLVSSASTINQRLAPLRDLVDQALENYLRLTDGCPQRLADAMRYSVMAPGKRLRPLLTLLAAEAVGGHARAALPAACAVELIHAYSLIHDDLPAMDNDDLRRGLPTCHRKFDEATAILAGDALQALAFEILSHEMPAERGLRCCQLLSRAAGRSQLVGGQADDLAAEGRFDAEIAAKHSVEHLQSIHLRKTGAIIQASLCLGL